MSSSQIRSITTKHLQGLYVLTFGEFWDRFSYFGTLTILVLYLTKFFLLGVDNSYLLYGIYLTFCFATPVLGGFFADKLIGHHKAIIAGAIFLIIGNLLLLIPTLRYVYLGLALTICGTGLYKANCTSMVGNLYDDNARKEKSFTIFYAGMNLGAVLAPIFYGIILVSFGWQYGFLLSAIGISIGLVLYLLKASILQVGNSCKSYYTKVKNFTTTGIICVFLIVITGIVNAAFYYPSIFEYFLGLFGLVTIVLLIIMAAKKDQVTRNQIFAILILDLFCIFFFAFTLQIGSSITMFIQLHIDRVLFNWKIPTIMFSALDPLFVVLTAPIFAIIWSKLARRNKEPFITTKMFLSFILLGIAFVSFTLAAWNHQRYLSLIWIIFGNCFLGAGEICLAVPVLSAISQFIPKNLQGTMMGVWFLAIAFAGFLSGLLAKFTDSTSIIKTQINHVDSISAYIHVFLYMSIFACILGIILYLLKSWIKKLLIIN